MILKDNHDKMIENLKWLGHASFKITGEKVVYIDPWNLKETEKADIILISHDHYDHCSSEDVKKIQKEDTVIVTTESCKQKLTGNIKVIQPNDKMTVEGITIEAVHAYNVNKEYHPKRQGIGFIVNINGKRIYFAGDTDNIPEMSELKNIDIALLPVGGTYTMNAEEAADAANKIKPKLAIPMHYGTIVGSNSDAEKFKELCEVPVTIL